MVDAVQGILGIEWIDGRSVRFLLGGGEEDEAPIEEGDYAEDEIGDVPEEEDPLSEYNVSRGIACNFSYGSVTERL
jgi:TP53 regulating kinase and related kinases